MGLIIKRVIPFFTFFYSRFFGRMIVFSMVALKAISPILDTLSFFEIVRNLNHGCLRCSKKNSLVNSMNYGVDFVPSLISTLKSECDLW
jgi:hypothetical protein